MILEEEREKSIQRTRELLLESEKLWMDKLAEVEAKLVAKGEGPSTPIIGKNSPKLPTPKTGEYGSDKASCNAAKGLENYEDEEPKDINPLGRILLPELGPKNCEEVKGEECELAVGSITNIVVLAKIIDTGAAYPTIHGVSLGDVNVRVSIYVALDKEAHLPFPIGDELVTVCEAVGSFVAWPKHLVILPTYKQPLKMKETKEALKKKPMSKKSKECLQCQGH